jgi:4-cresol dehydrogenase (hydroxylating)
LNNQDKAKGELALELILPPGLSKANFSTALEEFANICGPQWVLDTDIDRETYLDLYAPGLSAERAHAPSAAVVPQSVEQVQEIVRAANRFGIALWPICRGKNFGYGGAAPVMAGSVIVDLGRLNRIIEVNDKLAYATLEPGVGFFDLHEYLQQHNLPLWLSIPGNGWGSVVGNALERGFSRTPYGEHANSLCGMEVVLPTGELVRTGTGAMENSKTWPLFKSGFGPAWDGLFCQSNFGIVTRAGFWLMPEPEATLRMSMSLPNPEDIGWLVDVLTPLRISGLIPHNVGVANYMGSATTTSQRDEWYEGEGAIPESVVHNIMEQYGVGWWNFSITLNGDPQILERQRELIEAAFAPYTTETFSLSRWRRGEPGGGPTPSVFALRVVNWHGGRGAHMGFSPILPASGDEILQQLKRTRSRYLQHGIDFSSTFYICGRHVINVNLLLYNKDDHELVTRSNALFKDLVADSASAGFGEYRTHLDWMDSVANSFNFNKQALRRLNETVKDALDPEGILAPGKSGIWPKRLRESVVQEGTKGPTV